MGIIGTPHLGRWERGFTHAHRIHVSLVLLENKIQPEVDGPRPGDEGCQHCWALCIVRPRRCTGAPRCNGDQLLTTQVSKLVVWMEHSRVKDLVRPRRARPYTVSTLEDVAGCQWSREVLTGCPPDFLLHPRNPRDRGTDRTTPRFSATRCRGVRGSSFRVDRTRNRSRGDGN